MKRLALIACWLLAAACGSKTPAPAPSEPPPAAAPDSPANCAAPSEPGAALSPEQCTCLGGEVRGDIGDGAIACEPTERELGRVSIGIEGGVCCAPADAATP